MQFLIVSLAFLGMTSGGVVYTNGYFPTVYANSGFPLVYADTAAVAPVAVASIPVATVPISPEAQAVGDSIKCNLKALSESACKLAEGINCKAFFDCRKWCKKLTHQNVIPSTKGALLFYFLETNF